MFTIKQLIKAPTPANPGGYASSIGGRTLLIQGCDQGSVLTVTLTDSLGTRDTLTGVGAGAKMTPATGFTKVEISTTNDANVVFVVTNGDVDVQLSQLGSTITNTNLNPVPVSIVSEPGAPFQVSAPVGQEVNVRVQGSVAVTGATLTATNVGINNTPANPVPIETAINQTVATVAPVPVPANTVGVVLLAADATRRGTRFYNAGVNQVAIVPDNTTPLANAVIVLQPGDFWNETEAPGAAWWAASSLAGPTTVNLQTVKA